MHGFKSRHRYRQYSVDCIFSLINLTKNIHNFVDCFLNNSLEKQTNAGAYLEGAEPARAPLNSAKLLPPDVRF